MTPHRALLALAVGVTAASCQIPSRDNAYDPSRAPSVVVSVVRGPIGGAYEPVLEGFRFEPLKITLQGTSDPQGDTLYVDVYHFDPRTDDELGGTCPDRIPTAQIGTTLTWTSNELLEWNDYPDACFRDSPSGARMEVGLRAVARDSKGYIGVGVGRFILRNAAPVVVAPPPIWRDPLVDRPVALDVSRSFDTELEDLVFTWEFLSGPVALGPFTETGPLLEVDLEAAGALLPAATYRFGVSANDGWQESETAVVELVLSPAVWMGAADRLSLLDARWAQTDVVSAGGTPVAMPPLAKIVGGRDGVWLFSPFGALCAGNPASIRCDARYIRRDFTQTVFDMSPGYSFVSVLGSDPLAGVSWVRVVNGGTTRVMRVTETAATFETIADPIAADITEVLRLDAASPLWFVADDTVIRSVPGKTTETYPLSGTCIQNGSLLDVTIDPTGTWLLGTSSGEPSLLRVSLDGVEGPCLRLDDGSLGNDPPRAIEWTPGADGNGELLVGYRLRVAEVIDPATGARSSGPDIQVDFGGLKYDAPRDRIVATGPEATGTWSIGQYDIPRGITLVQNGLGIDSPGDTFAIDGSGQVWIARSDVLVPTKIAVLPPDLALVRATHPGESLNPFTVAAVDAATGHVWAVRPTADVTGLEAVAFDEYGPVPDPASPPGPALVPWAIPVPDGTIDMVFDPGTPTREPSFWVIAATLIGPGDFDYHLVRIGLDGAVLTDFGTGAEFPAAMLAERPTAPVVDPATGALWVSISSGPASGATRFNLDGVIDGWAPNWETNIAFSSSPRPRGAMDAAGRYWTFHYVGDGFEYVYHTNGTTRAFYPPGATDVCPDDGGFPQVPAAFFYDRTANEMVLLCAEYVPDEGRLYLTDALRLRANAAITLRSAFTVSGSFSDEGFLNPRDGTLWLPDSFDAAIQLYDRSHSTFSRQPVPNAVRVSVTR